jgi:hypothetical protein
MRTTSPPFTPQHYKPVLATTDHISHVYKFARKPNFMCTQLTSKWPLGLVVDSILGPLPVVKWSRITPEMSALTTGLANWYRLTSLVVGNSSSAYAVSKALSPAQQKSYRLLWQWWTAAYQYPARSLATTLDIISSCEDLSIFEEGNPELPQVWEVAIKHLQVRRWPVGDVKELRPYDEAGDSYSDVMRQHWEWEFTAYASVHTFTGSVEACGNIERARLQAALTSFCQLAAWSCYSTSSDERHSKNYLAADEGPDISKLSPARSHPADEADSMSLLKSCFDLNIQHGPAIETCRWLESGQREDGSLPYYL